jgi:excisionase family DNA binding protein
MLERLYTLQELVVLLKLSMSTLRREIRNGNLECAKAGRRGLIRVSESAVNAFLARATIGGRAPGELPSDAEEVPGEETTAVKVREGHVGANLSYRILNADVVVGLKTLAPGEASCAVTSPPYFWQRDYGIGGQIGHEATIQEYIDALVRAFDEVRRILRDDGVFFLNIGDAYYNAKGKPHGTDRKHSGRQLARKTLRAVDGPGLGLPRKSLIGLPWRVALAMQAKGWTLRSDIIWERPGCLAEPTAHDRPHRIYEHVFLFAKQPRYYFDRAALGGEEDIWTIKARPDNPHSHSAPFPAELADRCILCGCPDGGTVLDPFLGSGTSAISALKLGRHAIGVELSPDDCELSERRILNEIGRVSPDDQPISDAA